MKERWLKLQARIDAVSIRERALMFAAVAALMVFVLYVMLLDPLFARQRALRGQIAQQQNNMQGLDGEITALVAAHSIDPDLEARARLAAVQASSTVLADSLENTQTGLLAPERVAPLLETMLKSHGRLRLLSLKSLPPASITGGADDPEAATPAAIPAGRARLIYRHGVELTVRGNYLDMISYMDALKAAPAQLFWGKAALQVEEYPNARLTLTLYTLSLDKQWMTL